MTRVYPHYNYDLAEDLVVGLQNACGVEKVIEKVKERLSEVTDVQQQETIENIFDQEGNLVGEKSLELGQKFKDRAGEIMEEVAIKTGITFPSIPQRYFEIAITCARPSDKWLINAANVREFTYSVKNCSIINGLKSSITEEIASKMPCQKYCINMSQSIFNGLGIKVRGNYLASMVKDGYCRFQYLID